MLLRFVGPRLERARGRGSARSTRQVSAAGYDPSRQLLLAIPDGQPKRALAFRRVRASGLECSPVEEALQLLASPTAIPASPGDAANLTSGNCFDLSDQRRQIHGRRFVAKVTVKSISRRNLKEQPFKCKTGPDTPQPLILTLWDLNEIHRAAPMPTIEAAVFGSCAKKHQSE